MLCNHHSVSDQSVQVLELFMDLFGHLDAQTMVQIFGSLTEPSLAVLVLLGKGDDW